MPLTSFENLPDSARVWVYGADTRLGDDAARTLLERTDQFLASWAAHGAPLTSGRDLKENRFLTIAVDQRHEGASGCSIDGLFRTLRSLEAELGAKIVTSGLVYFRARNGEIRAVTREQFGELAAAGEIDGDSEVFDLSVTSLGEWRARFSSRAADSWHAALMPERV